MSEQPAKPSAAEGVGRVGRARRETTRATPLRQCLRLWTLGRSHMRWRSRKRTALGTTFRARIPAGGAAPMSQDSYPQWRRTWKREAHHQRVGVDVRPEGDIVIDVYDYAPVRGDWFLHFTA